MSLGIIPEPSFYPTTTTVTMCTVPPHRVVHTCICVHMLHECTYIYAMRPWDFRCTCEPVLNCLDVYHMYTAVMISLAF